MKRNKLYTVNQWNKPLFAQGVDRENNNIYDIAGFLNNATGRIGKVFGVDKMSESTKGLIGGLGTAVGGVAKGILSNGFSTGAGETVSNIGGTVGGLVSSINPLLGSIISSGTGILGGLINGATGIKWNDKVINAANQDIYSIRGIGDALGKVDTSDDFFKTAGNMSNFNEVDWGDLGSTGWLRSNDSLKSKAKELNEAGRRAMAYQTNALGNSANRIDNLMDSDIMANFAAYGGPLGFGTGALGLMQQNRYFDTIDKRSDALAGKTNNTQMPTGFTGAKTLAGGGELESALLDSFGTDPIGAAVRYSQGLEQMAAEKEMREAEAMREAQYLDMQKRLANLETQNQGLQTLMMAQPLYTLPVIPEEVPESSPTPSVAARATSSGNRNWDYIEDQLRKSGKFNDIQIEGIKYNLQRESSIDPTVVGDGGAAFGLGQWHGSRKPKDMSLEGQTQHLIDTLSKFDGKEHWIGKSNYEGFMNARTPEEAHYWIAKGYERPRADIVAKVKRDSDMSLKRMKAFGGELGTNGTDFTNGLLYIDEGGTHEENPMDGVPMGVDAEGIPNLVEEGETVYNNYVFSDRMKVPGFMYKELGLGGVMKKKGKEISFADASKKLAQESEQRPNDPISIAGLNASLAKLAEVQETERMKQQAEEYMGLEGYACGGKMGKKYEGFGEWPNILGWTPSWNPTTKELPKGLTVEEMRALAAEQAKQRQAQAAAPASNRRKATASDRSSNFDFGKGVSTEAPSVVPATPAMTDAEFREAFPMIARPSDTPQSTNWTDGSIWRGLADMPASSTQASSGVPVREEYDPYPTWMRYAPVVGAGIMSLTDMLGLTNKPDYTYASKIEAAANRAGYAPNIQYKPIGDYLRYRPMDIWYQQNALNAQARATDRALVNSTSPARAAGLLANGFNSQIASGNLYRQALEYNDAKRQQVADFNRRTNMFNSQMDLEAAMANARYAQQARQMGLSGLAQAAALRDSIDQRVGAARSANLTNFLTSLGNIGRENFALNQINSDRSRRHGARANGTSFDKVAEKKSCGGKMKK